MNTASDICSVCGAHLAEQTITFVQERAGLIYLVAGVPADVCPQCGERYLAPSTVDDIQRVLDSGDAPAVTHVPTYQLERKAS